MSNPAIPASVYDALFTSVADELNETEADEREPHDILQDVAEVLAHREVFSDAFWAVWDSTVSDARHLYQKVIAHELSK